MSFEGLSMRGVLGRGSFGEVREAVHRATGRKLAIKCIEKAKLNRKRRDRIQMEVDVLTSLADHEGICRLHQAAQDDRFVYLFLEHMNGGDLFDYVQQRGGPLDEREEVRPLFRQLCEAVVHCHTKGVVHHDIKLENCMISFPMEPPPSPQSSRHGDAGDDEEDEPEDKNDDSRGEETDDEDEPPTAKMTTSRQRRASSTNDHPSRRRLPEGARVKLIDFGLACRVKHAGQLLATFSGTEQYAAPEVLEGRAYDGFKTDAYALGVILYLLLTSAYPFSPDDIDVQFDEQTSPAFLASIPFPSHISHHARDLVWSLLRPDPRKRVTLEAALRHPFFLDPVTTATAQGETMTRRDEIYGRSDSTAGRAAEQQEGDHARTGFWQDELQVAAVLASFDVDSDDMSLGYS